MKILICGLNFFPELTGIGKYSGEMSQWLVGRGHEVRVVSAPPYYPQWAVLPGYNRWWYRYRVEDGIQVWRCPLWVPSAPTGLKRLVHLFSYAVTSFPLMLVAMFWRPNIVMCIEPPLFCAPTTLLVAWLSGGKSWLHVQDFEVPAFFRLGFGGSRRLEKLATGIEGWLTRKFDRVSSISFSMVKRLEALGVASEKCHLVPNWVDIEHIRPLSRDVSLRARLGIPEDTFVALYSGNMGKKQGLEMVVEAAKHYQDIRPELLFLLVGDGAARSELESRVAGSGLPNVRIMPLFPLEELPNLLASADLHLVIQKRGAADVVMPSKITGILAAGGTVLITADRETELGRLVESFPGIGVCVEPEDIDCFIEGLEQSIQRIKDDGYQNATSRAFAEKYLDKNAVLESFEHIMENSL